MSLFDLAEINSLQQLFLRETVVQLTNLKSRETIKVEGLRVKFDVTKTISSKPNEGTIEIYNLNDQTRKFCEIPAENDEQIAKNGLYVALSAGYKKLTRQIFAGYASGGSEYKSPDWISKFKVIDGKTEIRTKTFEKSYKAGVPMQTVLMDVILSLGLPLGFIKSPLSTDIVQYGLSLSAPIKDILDGYSKKYGFYWSIQSGSVQIIDVSESLPGTAVVIGPKSGLLASPVRTDKGVEFETLLIPFLKPGGLVRLIDNLTYTGIVQITSIKFSGDNKEGDFKAFAEAKVL